MAVDFLSRSMIQSRAYHHEWNVGFLLHGIQSWWQTGSLLEKWEIVLTNTCGSRRARRSSFLIFFSLVHSLAWTIPRRDFFFHLWSSASRTSTSKSTISTRDSNKFLKSLSSTARLFFHYVTIEVMSSNYTLMMLMMTRFERWTTDAHIVDDEKKFERKVHDSDKSFSMRKQMMASAVNQLVDRPLHSFLLAFVVQTMWRANALLSESLQVY